MSDDPAEDPAFPRYIRREHEERAIREVLEMVREDGQSRVVLLYGPGGIGKTRLVREMARKGSDEHTQWLAPIDADDPEFWLLSNLESRIASTLDPDSTHFGPYKKYLAQFPSYALPAIRQETIVSHLGRIKNDFVSCYESLTHESGARQTVVLAFDTVETIRGMFLLATLIQWMKELPSTLFILAGRPQRSRTGPDPIMAELESRDRCLPTVPIEMGALPQGLARQYLDASPVCLGMPGDRKDKIVCLTRGHPLWLAFTLDYLRSEGTPPELNDLSLNELKARIPYEGELQRPGQALRERFLRGLVTPYRETDFMHEAVKRLAVVRQGVTKPVWTRLMADRPLPAEVKSFDAAWDQLLLSPWVRQRAGGRLVTLQDAVAEALAERIFPVHDQDWHWRQQIWELAEATYSGMLQAEQRTINTRGDQLDTQLTEVDRQLRETGEHQRRMTGEHLRPTPRQIEAWRQGEEDAPTDEHRLMREVADLDVDRGRLDQLKAIHLYYLFLCNFSDGSAELLRLLEQARQEGDNQLTDLLAQEIQRFLFRAPSQELDDVIRPKLSQFREWLRGDGAKSYLDIGLQLMRYLIDRDQPRLALQTLSQLPTRRAGLAQQYQVAILRGNAAMRIPDQVNDAAHYFNEARKVAERAEEADRPALLAQVHKELGFYYRNIGMWHAADRSYKAARDALQAPPGQRRNRAEIASIQTNWAYTKGLIGNYDEAIDLAENAIKIRHSLGLQQEEAISWSVRGEVHRYERRFSKASEAYEVAERIFEGRQNWPWLGVIYQQQAICLFQQAQDDISQVCDLRLADQARTLIQKALAICGAQNKRAYPSALNRAGRIFGAAEPQTGLDFLWRGVEVARDLSDGWFLFANLIEHAELCYRVWADSRLPAFRERIRAQAPETERVMARYRFPDLRGRWNLLRGHLALHDYLRHISEGEPAVARERYREAAARYREGFRDLAQGRVGSSGTAYLTSAFSVFGKLTERLPAETRATLLSSLSEAWRRDEDDDVATRLLANLTVL